MARVAFGPQVLACMHRLQRRAASIKLDSFRDLTGHLFRLCSHTMAWSINIKAQLGVYFRMYMANFDAIVYFNADLGICMRTCNHGQSLAMHSGMFPHTIISA